MWPTCQVVSAKCPGFFGRLLVIRCSRNQGRDGRRFGNAGSHAPGARQGRVPSSESGRGSRSGSKGILAGGISETSKPAVGGQYGHSKSSAKLPSIGSPSQRISLIDGQLLICMPDQRIAFGWWSFPNAFKICPRFAVELFETLMIFEHYSDHFLVEIFWNPGLKFAPGF